MLRHTSRLPFWPESYHLVYIHCPSTPRFIIASCPDPCFVLVPLTVSLLSNLIFDDCVSICHRDALASRCKRQGQSRGIATRHCWFPRYLGRGFSTRQRSSFNTFAMDISAAANPGSASPHEADQANDTRTSSRLRNGGFLRQSQRRRESHWKYCLVRLH